MAYDWTPGGWDDPANLLKGSEYEDSAGYFAGNPDFIRPSRAAEDEYLRRLAAEQRRRQAERDANAQRPRLLDASGALTILATAPRPLKRRHVSVSRGNWPPGQATVQAAPSPARAPGSTTFAPGGRPQQQARTPVAPNVANQLRRGTQTVTPAASQPKFAEFKLGPSKVKGFRAPKAVDRGAARSALDALDIGSDLGAANEWEQRAAQRFDKGFDPGAGQFQGKELADTVFSEAQVNQMAQQRAAPTIRALQDAQRTFAQAAGATGNFDAGKRAALAARAQLEGASAINAGTRDAQLDAAAANAEQAARAAANRRENFQTDLGARLGLGGMELDAAQSLLSAGSARRGQDYGLATDRARSEIDLSNAIADERLRGAGLGLQARGQDIERELSRARLQLEGRGQDIERGLSERRLGLEEQLGLGRLDLERQLGGGRLDLDRYRTDAEISSQAAERQNRLQMLDRQLASEGLDRQSRESLERERIALQREIAQSQLGLDRERMAQQGSQFERELGERARQFDSGQSFAGEQAGLDRELRTREGRRERDFGREMAGRNRQWQQEDAARLEALREEMLAEQFGGRREQAILDNLLGPLGNLVQSGEISPENYQEIVDQVMRDLRREGRKPNPFEMMVSGPWQPQNPYGGFYSWSSN